MENLEERFEEYLNEINDIFPILEATVERHFSSSNMDRQRYLQTLIDVLITQGNGINFISGENNRQMYQDSDGKCQNGFGIHYMTAQIAKTFAEADPNTLNKISGSLSHPDNPDYVGRMDVISGPVYQHTLLDFSKQIETNDILRANVINAYTGLHQTIAPQNKDNYTK